MSGELCVLNISTGAVCVLINDEPLFRDVLPGECTRKEPVPVGTGHAIILNNREKVSGDFLFSVKKKACHTLIVTDTGFFIR